MMGAITDGGVALIRAEIRQVRSNLGIHEKEKAYMSEGIRERETERDRETERQKDRKGDAQRPSLPCAFSTKSTKFPSLV
jgi:hypothetical protein